MHLTIKLTITGQNSFVDGQKYTFTHKTITSESFDARFIGNSRIDGWLFGNDALKLHPIFRVAKSDMNSAHSLMDYEFPNITITHIDIIQALEDHMANWNFKESSYQKNSSILLEYCMDHFKLTRNDLYDDDRFKHMMREIILDGLLPKADNK